MQRTKTWRDTLTDRANGLVPGFGGCPDTGADVTELSWDQLRAAAKAAGVPVKGSRADIEDALTANQNEG